MAAGAVIGYRVTVGRGCYIGAGATLRTRWSETGYFCMQAWIGQDGFGFAMGPEATSRCRRSAASSFRTM